ncbi:golgin candidate 1 isoform X1 [Camellia sinensis]|uniref:golgin candidate 1 isoform X1 n=1 Tax=Camellia sinensis TaxID=4442 RepID=UPI001035DA90|nr:golgin candidate 1 isoform X1 [Camellia sinensis]
MAAWLKAAEDLFEVVDRRAKLAVGDNPDEQINSLLPASNGQGSQTKRTRLKAKAKAKAQKRPSSNETAKTIDTSIEQNSSETLQSDVAPDKDRVVFSIENDGTSPSNSNAQKSNEEQHNVEKDGSISGSLLSESILNEEAKHDAVHEEAPAAVPHVEANALISNDELTNKDSSDVHEGVSSSPIAVKGVEVVHEDPPIDSSSNIRVGDAGTPTKIDEEVSQSISVDAPSKVHMQLKDADLKVEPHSNQKKQQEQKADSSPIKVQDALDEAQGLLKTAISTGQSKEARLARVCAGLQSRLQEYKSENAQLEELLTAERELSKSYEVRIKQLQKDLSSAKSEVTKVESSMGEALAAKNSEIEALVSSMDALKKQAALSEGNLASLQANMESIMRNRELTETRMMQAVREELASVERRAEEERAAHNATKMAAMEREVELEHRALESSTALARIQRTADERTAKVAELEQKVALLEVECASLNQELQDMEARARRGQKKCPEDANQMIQMQAWQEEAERARQGQRDAESKLSSLEAEVQKMRVEMSAMKRDAEHYSRQEHMELEKRYRELTDLLYYKQTQLEAMASEKAAAEFQLEKEMKRLQEAQVEAERSRVSRRASSSWEEDTDMKTLDNCRPLPLYHRHMVGASIQLQNAAKLLDSGAVRATRFLWRYPIARILLLFYLVFVHFFLMYLLHRLQEQADSFSSREVAESMGLANHTLQ